MHALIKQVTMIQVGVWLNAKDYELVWFNDKNQPHFCRIARNSIDAHGELDMLLRQSLSAKLRFAPKFASAMPPHQAWSKTLIFPYVLTETECHQQCRHSLTKSLPIALEELWFDYTTERYQKGMRMDIFALRKVFGEAFVQQLHPFKIQILDTFVHCLTKAIQYLFQSTMPTAPIILYQDEQLSVAFRNHQQEWQILNKTGADLTALYLQFIQQYQAEHSEILIYDHNRQQVNFALPHRVVHSELPLIALGAALWQKDIFQDAN